MAESEQARDVCVLCGRDEQATPLIPLKHRGGGSWICPQHLPVLIHEPARLAGRLPGAENLEPAKPDHER